MWLVYVGRCWSRTHRGHLPVVAACLAIAAAVLTGCGAGPSERDHTVAGTGTLYLDEVEGGGVVFDADTGHRYRLARASADGRGVPAVASGERVRVYLEGERTGAAVTEAMRGMPLAVRVVVPVQVDRVFQVAPDEAARVTLQDSTGLTYHFEGLPALLQHPGVAQAMRAHGAGVHVQGRIRPDTLRQAAAHLEVAVHAARLRRDDVRGGLGRLERDDAGAYALRTLPDSARLPAALLPPALGRWRGPVRYTAVRDTAGVWVLTYLAPAHRDEVSRTGFAVQDADSLWLVDEHFARVAGAPLAHEAGWQGTLWSRPGASGGDQWTDAQAFASPQPLVAEVKAVELEGGFYGLETADGTRLLPSNLPPPLRAPGRRLAIRTLPDTDRVTARLWGTPVHLLDARPLD